MCVTHTALWYGISAAVSEQPQHDFPIAMSRCCVRFHLAIYKRHRTAAILSAAAAACLSLLLKKSTEQRRGPITAGENKKLHRLAKLARQLIGKESLSVCARSVNQMRLVLGHGCVHVLLDQLKTLPKFQ